LSVPQADLFGAGPAFPEGFRYAPEVIGAGEEAELIAGFADLPFREFEFQGYTGKRRVVSFGWQYDFNTRGSGGRRTFRVIVALREKAASFAGMVRRAAAGADHGICARRGYRLAPGQGGVR
jgi:hypothetical protein